MMGNQATFGRFFSYQSGCGSTKTFNGRFYCIALQIKSLNYVICKHAIYASSKISYPKFRKKNGESCRSIRDKRVSTSYEEKLMLLNFKATV